MLDTAIYFKVTENLSYLRSKVSFSFDVGVGVDHIGTIRVLSIGELLAHRLQPEVWGVWDALFRVRKHASYRK